MSYFITRQIRWPDGEHIVEVVGGSFDNAGSDTIGKKYPGEWDEHLDPREAVETAIQIRKAWRKDSGKKIGLAVAGAFAAQFVNAEPVSKKQARKWAKKQWEELPKCARCGEIMGKNRYTSYLLRYDGDEFCSEHCAEEAYWQAVLPEDED